MGWRQGGSLWWPSTNIFSCIASLGTAFSPSALLDGSGSGGIICVSSFSLSLCVDGGFHEQAS